MGKISADPPILAGLTYVRPLGSGGFADVFLYEQAMPRRTVAVKVLPGDVADEELVRMFNAEADVLAKLSTHPSIVTVYDAGISADGRAYIVMEYCPGAFSPMYRNHRIPLANVLEVGVKMACAIESAHRAGVLHRDIKPGNILVTSFGAPVLADFGVAASATAMVADKFFAMTVPWTAPEVLAEKTSGDVASEIWSIGATTYSLLAGRSPFEHTDPAKNTRDLLRKRIMKATYVPIQVPGIPATLQHVLARSMDRIPHRRYASALEFAEAVQQVQRELNLAVTPLELAHTPWESGEVQFDDQIQRGPARIRVEHPTNRKTLRSPDLPPRGSSETAERISPGKTKRIWPLVAAGLIIVLAISIGAAIALTAG